MKGIADTGFIVAFRNRTDEHHAWALDIARRVTDPLLTCESVLSESAFQIGSSKAVLDLVNDGLVQLAFDLDASLEQIQDLATRYADRHPDFADLCLIRMSELHPRHQVITVDEDFRVYRRNKREAIPLLTPPKK
jgi:predicted nucleic acid-binding protein